MLFITKSVAWNFVRSGRATPDDPCGVQMIYPGPIWSGLTGQTQRLGSVELFLNIINGVLVNPIKN